MSKSTEKVKKKYADTYKWTDDEVELLLMVTNTKRSKSPKASTGNLVLTSMPTVH